MYKWDVHFTYYSDKIKIDSPYNKEFISEIKKIGGKWDKWLKDWTINREYETEAKKIVFDIYGINMNDRTRIKIKYFAKDFHHGSSIIVGPYTTAVRRWRDSEVIFNYDTPIVDGEEFSRSGGSNNHPDIEPDDSTVLVSTIEKSVYDRFIADAEESDYITVVDTLSAEDDTYHKLARAHYIIVEEIHRLQKEAEELEEKLKKYENQ